MFVFLTVKGEPSVLSLDSWIKEIFEIVIIMIDVWQKQWAMCNRNNELYLTLWILFSGYALDSIHEAADPVDSVLKSEAIFIGNSFFLFYFEEDKIKFSVILYKAPLLYFSTLPSPNPTPILQVTRKTKKPTKIYYKLHFNKVKVPK